MREFLQYVRDQIKNRKPDWIVEVAGTDSDVCVYPRKFCWGMMVSLESGRVFCEANHKMIYSADLSRPGSQVDFDKLVNSMDEIFLSPEWSTNPKDELGG